MGPPRLAVMASGRGSNLGALMAAEDEGRLGARVAVVISDNPDAPALDRARSAGREAVAIDAGASRSRLSPEAEERLIRALAERGVTLIALAGFMRIVGPRLLDAYPERILNIHPSLLPAFRGLDAQRRAWEHGVRLAGCTVHFVTRGVDEGPIILQAAVPVLAQDTPESLAERILVEEHRIYPKAVRLVAEGRARIEGRRVLIDESGADWLAGF
jgi:phosphoribosylglycinamide formyltransferase-1